MSIKNLETDVLVITVYILMSWEVILKLQKSHFILYVFRANYLHINETPQETHSNALQMIQNTLANE